MSTSTNKTEIDTVEIEKTKEHESPSRQLEETESAAFQNDEFPKQSPMPEEFQLPAELQEVKIEDEPETEPILQDDLVDEEALKEEEANLTEEDFVTRFENAKTYKKEGNDEFGKMNYRDAILTYTKGLLICPLRDTEFRSILYANRSAAKIKMGRKDLAIDDCTKSIENKPDYVRAILRRAKLYEETEKLDEALADYQKVYELDPSVRDAWNAMQRLPGQIHEKNEKLKEEMLGKLKDLGNMILRPFGLSTDNFKLQQDPNSGGYSVNFSK